MTEHGGVEPAIGALAVSTAPAMPAVAPVAVSPVAVAPVAVSAVLPVVSAPPGAGPQVEPEALLASGRVAGELIWWPPLTALYLLVMPDWQPLGVALLGAALLVLGALRAAVRVGLHAGDGRDGSPTPPPRAGRLPAARHG